MASAYKDLCIQFDGDTSKLNRALADLRKQSTKVKRELRAIDKALELDPGNVELLGQKARYTSQQASILQERMELGLVASQDDTAQNSGPNRPTARASATASGTTPPSSPST